MIRLLAVDDHPAILSAIEAGAASAGDVAVVGVATSAELAASLITESDPDVVVCDLWLGTEAGGLRLVAAQGRRSRPRMLVYTGFEHRSFLRAAFEAGAVGYLSKAATIDELLLAVRHVAGGATIFPPATLVALRDAPRRPTERELQAILLLAAGATNDEIAMQLGISIKTVESHLRRLFGRYGVLSRTELAVLAAREGWLGSLG